MATSFRLFFTMTVTSAVQGHGPIFMDEHMVAILDFDDLVDALYELLGQNIKIYAPKTIGSDECGLQ